MTMGETELRARLAGIKAGGYLELATMDLAPLVDAMLCHIGSTDSELRDDLIYEAFVEIILHLDPHPGLMFRIFAACLDLVVDGIDTDDPDTVFGRSFSMLVMALVLERDLQRPFLGEARTREAFDRICDAYRRERVLTGYHPDKGWAHTVAHTADAFALVVRSEALGNAEAGQVLELIGGKFLQPLYRFTDGEDERTARVIEAILQAKPSMQGPVMEWAASLARSRLPEAMPARSIVKGNVRDLLRSIYFICDRDEALRRRIEESLKVLGFS
jgi:hypothetical protein